MNRRRFLKWALTTGAAASVLGTVYGRLEAQWARIDRQTLAVPNLPPVFEGKTLAVLADVHHSKWVRLEFIESIVDRTAKLKPDLIALPGDFVHSHPNHIYMRPCIEALSKLQAPLGVFAVPGNHDHWDEIELLHDSLREFGITNLTNTGQWIELDGQRVRLAGVDDLWEGQIDMSAALGDARAGDCTVLLCHNPDYVERIRDRRVSLVLSGHTHGGQINLPGYYRHVPSRYGKKYLAGLVRTSWTQVYVSRGLGTSGPPLRFCCRPEINLLTLTAA